jgi:hypothetical protein
MRGVVLMRSGMTEKQNGSDVEKERGADGRAIEDIGGR